MIERVSEVSFFQHYRLLTFTFDFFAIISLSLIIIFPIKRAGLQIIAFTYRQTLVLLSIV